MLLSCFYVAYIFIVADIWILFTNIFQIKIDKKSPNNEIKQQQFKEADKTKKIIKEDSALEIKSKRKTK